MFGCMLRWLCLGFAIPLCCSSGVISTDSHLYQSPRTFNNVNPPSPLRTVQHGCFSSHDPRKIIGALLLHCYCFSLHDPFISVFEVHCHAVRGRKKGVKRSSWTGFPLKNLSILKHSTSNASLDLHCKLPSRCKFIFWTHPAPNVQRLLGKWACLGLTFHA